MLIPVAMLLYHTPPRITWSTVALFAFQMASIFGVVEYGASKFRRENSIPLFVEIVLAVLLLTVILQSEVGALVVALLALLPRQKHAAEASQPQ